MPLPGIRSREAKQCHAKAKSTQLQCLNPAAFGCSTCRLHGARRNIKKGKYHPNYQHGRETQEMRHTRQQKLAELDQLEALMRAKGLLTGPRKVGRKFVPNS